MTKEEYWKLHVEQNGDGLDCGMCEAHFNLGLDAAHKCGMEWISIKDEDTLPIPPCLAFWGDGKYTILASQNDCEHAVYNTDVVLTRWMPLPKPPKTGE